MNKTLIVLQSIGYGGSMTSLINLMSLIDYKYKKNIDVLFMDPYGELYNDANNVMNIVCDRTIEAVTLPRNKQINLHKYFLWGYRAFLCICAKLHNKSTLDYAYEKVAKKYEDKYSCVIAYQESIATNFVSKIDCEKKITWVHNDYSNVVKMYNTKEKFISVYNKFDKIVCVSKAGMNNFKRYSGIDEDKITFIYNTLIENTIREKANKCNPLVEESSIENKIKLVSSGRFANQKRFDKLVEAAHMLDKEKFDFKWYVLGEGPLFDEIKKRVIEYGLEDKVILTGAMTNPFPIIKMADVFVLTSDFEAHPMVANEALILGKPVITTCFESAKEVVRHEVNGLICGMDAEDIYMSIKRIIIDKNLFVELTKNAQANKYDNKDIISKVLKIIEE